MVPKKNISYSVRKNTKRNEDPDFLEDFNTRLDKLEHRLQSSIKHRKKRHANNNRSMSSWKMDFANPYFKNRKSIDPN